MTSNIEDTIAGTSIKKNPELPAPKIVKTQGIESGVIETPIRDDMPVPPATPVKVPRVKKEVTIREVDNGYILQVWAGPFKEEWVFGKLGKAIKAIIAFLNVKTEDEN